MVNYGEAILKIVNNAQGIKNIDLALKVMEVINPIVFSHERFNQKLTELVMFNEILELKYNTPNSLPTSLFFPIGTIITL